MFRLAFNVVYQKIRSLNSCLSPSRLHEQHYTIGNDVFEAMLDPTMSYSCAYWKNAETLEQAQLNKLEMICQKLELKEGERLLDIGCGWGGLAEYAAKEYGVEVTCITIFEQQKKLAEERCQGLPVEVNVMDYRALNRNFDKIASINMLEHVGVQHYRTYFKKISQLFNKHGLFLLQTTGLHKTMRPYDPWLNKYIFTNLESPSAAQLTQAVNNIFLIEDWHDMGLDYDRTFIAWAQKFDQNWHTLAQCYDKRFYRMWKYYLLSCAGQFRSRQALLWQVVFSRRTKKTPYHSKRNFGVTV